MHTDKATRLQLLDLTLIQILMRRMRAWGRWSIRWSIRCPASLNSSTRRPRCRRSRWIGMQWSSAVRPCNLRRQARRRTGYGFRAMVFSVMNWPDGVSSMTRNIGAERCWVSDKPRPGWMFIRTAPRATAPRRLMLTVCWPVFICHPAPTCLRAVGWDACSRSRCCPRRMWSGSSWAAPWTRRTMPVRRYAHASR